MSEIYFETIDTDNNEVTQFVFWYYNKQQWGTNIDQEIHHHMDTFIQEHFGYGKNQQEEIDSHLIQLPNEFNEHKDKDKDKDNYNYKITYQIDEYTLIWTICEDMEGSGDKKFLITAKLLENGLEIKDENQYPSFIYQLYEHIDNIKNNIKKAVKYANEEYLEECHYNSRLEYARDHC